MSYRHVPRKPEQIWVVVADRSTARIFAAADSSIADLAEIDTLIHSEGACRPQEVQSDRPGRFVGINGARSSGDPKTDFVHQTAREFACEVTEALERGRKENLFGRLVVIAPPVFLGSLRKSLAEPLRTMLVAEVEKEMIHARIKEVADHVRQALAVDAVSLK